MGAYINPVDQEKEEWLYRYGVPAGNTPPSIDFIPDHLPVCLVDNGPFTAAGIAFDERELAAFSHPDGRPKQWFWVTKARLMNPQVSDLHFYLKD